MQSPYTREVTQLCFHGCFPTPHFTLNEPGKATAAKAVTSSAENRRSFACATTSSLFPNTEFSNPESLPTLQEAYYEFIRAYPQFSETGQIDDIRVQEYYHLSLSNHVCLDYIGIGLFSFSQLHNQLSFAASTSTSPPQIPPHSSDFPIFHLSYKSINVKKQLLEGSREDESKLECAIKRRIRDFLHISEDDYSVILTSNRTSAFKIVAESYPFGSHKKLVTVYDHESESIGEMTSTAEKRGAQAMAAEFTWPRLRIHSSKLRNMIISKGTRSKKRGLFVFQLQSRVTGSRYSYQWMRVAQENGWHVLLDACAIGPKDMDSLGLSLFKPDFIVCSFYKVFGENPSGFGCLFVKKSAISILDASTTAGIVGLVTAKRLFYLPEEESSGTVTDVEPVQVLSSSSSLSEIIEEEKANYISQGINKGTCRKANTQVQCRGLDHVDSLGLSIVNSRGRYLVNWLIHALKKLRHPNSQNGVRLVKIYGPKIKFDRGPALAFNLFDWKGDKIEPILVQKLADRKNISLSYAFLHHIWFPDKYEEDKSKVLEKRRYEASENPGNKRKGKEDIGVRVITAAFGFIANFADVYRLWAFIAQFLDADFVEKERWRYSALNQQTLEI